MKRPKAQIRLVVCPTFSGINKQGLKHIAKKIEYGRADRCLLPWSPSVFVPLARPSCLHGLSG
jgi:hypothetical protein